MNHLTLKTSKRIKSPSTLTADSSSNTLYWWILVGRRVGEVEHRGEKVGSFLVSTSLNIVLCISPPLSSTSPAYRGVGPPFRHFRPSNPESGSYTSGVTIGVFRLVLTRRVPSPTVQTQVPARLTACCSMPQAILAVLQETIPQYFWLSSSRAGFPFPVLTSRATALSFRSMDR